MDSLTITLAIVFLLVTGSLLWRIISHFYIIPWPYWMAWFLENPYMKIVSPNEAIVDKLDLKPGQKLLDLGCGAGRISVPAAKRLGRDGRITAIDVQKGMIKQLERRAQKHKVENITSINAAIHRGLLQKNVYDRAVMVTVLGEIPNRKEALEEIFASLKPLGTLSITEVLPDPCFVTRAAVKKMCIEIGFKPDRYWTNLLSYQYRFVKPS